MRKSCLFKVLVTPMVLFLTTIANADDTVNCEEALNCFDQKELFFVAESTFFRFHDSGGVEDGEGDDAELGYDASSRLTLGYTDCNGRGARVRWWDYDHSTRSVDNDVVSVDTYNIDLEVFQTINLPCRTTLDLGVGIRYNEFQHDFEQSGWFKTNEEHSFNGVGGMFAIAGSFDINCNWTAYTMFREVIMMDDAVFKGHVENDTTRPITELGFGVRFHRCNWDVHAGFEWQNWGNYTSAGVANLDEEAHDVGFGGFVLGAGVTY